MNMIDRRRAWHLDEEPGLVYKPPSPGFSSMLTPEQMGYLCYVPHDIMHNMSYTIRSARRLTEKEISVYKVKLDRLHAFNCGMAATFKAQVEDLMKKNKDDYNPGLVVQKIQKLIEDQHADLVRFAEIQKLDPTELEIADQLLWEAQMDGRTS